MEKKWFIVYTKNSAELKVSELLTKKKIRNYCPLSNNREKMGSKAKKSPLFKSYVFVHVTEMELPKIKLMDNIISVVYWLGRPAVIRNREIQVIEEFTRNYQDIQLVKDPVSNNSDVEIQVKVLNQLNDSLTFINNQQISAYLPSLGYMMIADFTETAISFESTVVNTFTPSFEMVKVNN